MADRITVDVADARERLARHLYELVTSRSFATPNWDRQPDYVQDNWRVHADEVLAVITDKES